MATKGKLTLQVRSLILKCLQKTYDIFNVEKSNFKSSYLPFYYSIGFRNQQDLSFVWFETKIYLPNKFLFL